MKAATKCSSVLLLECMLLLWSSVAHAARGTIVHRISGCDYFMVQSGRLYDVLEWYGGHDPDKDDVIVGKFEIYGMADIYDETADEELRVWVEEYAITKSDALEKLADKCE
jgi:hypothetical protein